MKAMILAAGLGTRLRPLTNQVPKAMVEIKGKTLLELVIERLIHAGVSEVMINLHHFPEQIQRFLAQKNNFGVHVSVSVEEQLLDTGGGLKNVAYFFRGSEPFILHNVDIYSNIDLKNMVKQHISRDVLATLAVQNRRSSRYLIFDSEGMLCGWKSLQDGRIILSRSPKGEMRDLAFCGIHVISPQIFAKMSEQGAFSIIDCYLRLAETGERILAFPADGSFWYDLGKPDVLEKLQKSNESELLY